MSLGDLALIVAAGLAGPLLAASRRAFVPVVVGEIFAGVVLGRSGLDVIDVDNATVSFLAEAGFAMLMLTVGMHVPLRDRRLRQALGPGALAAGVVAIAAPLGGLVVAELTGTGHIAVYAVLLASGSAAIVLPMLQERKLDGPEALVVIAQVTVADVAAILAVPLVLQPSRAANAALGGLLIAACALTLFFVARSLRPRPWVHRLRHRSKKRGWALDLRLSLAVLFGLAWIAQQSGTSVLLAGFGMGLVVAAIGGPKRLSTQVRGVAEGFFVPLFFVVLGARLDVSALLDHPDLLLVTALAHRAQSRHPRLRRDGHAPATVRGPDRDGPTRRPRRGGTDRPSRTRHHPGPGRRDNRRRPGVDRPLRPRHVPARPPSRAPTHPGKSPARPVAAAAGRALDPSHSWRLRT